MVVHCRLNLVFLHQSYAVSVPGGDNLLKIHGSWEGMLKQEQNKQLMAAWRREGTPSVHCHSYSTHYL